MHLGRFNAVVYDLTVHFLNAKLPEKIEACATALDVYSVAKTQDAKKTFDTSLSTLLESADITDLDLLQPYAQQAISELSIEETINPAFSEKVKKCISNSAYDPAGISAELRELAKKVKEKIDQLIAMDEAFTKLNVEYHRVDHDEAELGFILPREIVGVKLKDISNELSEINKLLRAVNELCNTENYDSEVITISSSWWQIFLNVDPATVALIILSIEKIIDLFKSNLEIKALQKNLAEKEIPREITEQIGTEIENRISRKIENIAKELRDDHAKIDDENRLNELETQLRHGLFYLAKRINQGAKIEINIGIPNAPSPLVSNDGTSIDKELLAQHQEELKRIDDLRSLQERARMASQKTLEIDTETPLLLPEKNDQNDQPVA